MISLYDSDSGEVIGEITEQQLQFLIDQLEEETFEDQDYAIEAMTLAYFESQSADPELLAILKNGLGDKDQMIIRWSQD